MFGSKYKAGKVYGIAQHALGYVVLKTNYIITKEKFKTDFIEVKDESKLDRRYQTNDASI